MLLLLAVAVARADVQLGLGSVGGTRGETVLVPLMLGGADLPVAFQVDVKFDPAKLWALGPISSTNQSNHLVTASAVAPGVYRVVVHSDQNAALSAGKVVDLKFLVLDGGLPGAAPLALASVIAVKPTGAPFLPVSITAGAVDVQTLRFLGIVIQGNGKAELSLYSEGETAAVVEGSGDFKVWIPLMTNTVPGAGVWKYVDESQPSAKFFRARVH